MTHKEAKERVRSWLRDWAIPAGAVLVTATGAWVKMEQLTNDHARRISELEVRVARIYDVGSDGFCDSFIHSAHDLHLRHEINGKYISCEQFDAWRRSLYQLNPGIIEPEFDHREVKPR